MTEIDVEQLKSWEGRSETSEDVLWPTPARALAATLDRDPDALVEGVALPPLYHWVYFPILTRASELARDGHAKKGAFMPPVPFPRRMFAGARLDYEGTLRLGDRVQRAVTIESVAYKEGRSGPLVFVTVGYELRNDAGARIVEQQDLAYRPATSSQRGATTRERAVCEGATFERSIEPDEALLFRYSALTFNGHRIHYDLPFAQSEGYPSLVIHGPLTATLLADLVTHSAEVTQLAQFSFRAKRAFCLGEPLRLMGWRQSREVTLLAVDRDGEARVEARAVLP